VRELKPFHPIVRKWFTEELGKPSAPQRLGWPAIASGEHTLILAPTGTGKTLAAFLWEIDRLIREGLEQPLANAVHLLYISPLKALNNDVRRNLERPLAELRDRFTAEGHAFPDIRIAVRTGDTPSKERQRMLRSTPHILITTPESLHILLTSMRGREIFSSLRTVIIDEIHAVAGTKRGAHLALTLERLERRCAQTGNDSPQRIGLSATQRPLEEIARFLGGMNVGTGPRDVSIIDCGLVKQMDIDVVSPIENLNEIGGTIWPAVYPKLLDYINRSRTTLIFVNNRGQAERIAAKINAIAESEVALPYHGSLDRERRLILEERLKAGELRALVATSSLELGIDIGTVDLVLQVSSPKRVASGLQRVGRAGHSLDAVSRGVLMPLFRDDALELLAVAEGMREGDVEPTSVVQNALDVLAQVVVAVSSVEDITSAELFDLVRSSYPYHSITRAAFDEVLDMLAGKYPADLAAELEARISWDRTTDVISGSRGGRMVSVISGGTIPDRGYYTVNLPDRTRLGELDEEFVHESRIGDVFQLGSTTWRIQAMEHDRVIVIPAPGAPARMPFWHGEFMARSAHLSRRVGDLRRALRDADGDDDVRAVAERYGCDEQTASSLVEYVGRQRAATGVVPDDRTLLLEQFRDEVGSVRVVLHAPFGGRVTAPWGMALAQRVRESLARVGGADAEGTDIQVQTTDDGIMLRLPALGTTMPVEAMLGLSYQEAHKRVLDEVGGSSLFGARFRMNAARALLLPRGTARRRMPLWLQRLKALDLLQVVKEFPSFPILVETYRDVLSDAFDMPALEAVLNALERGELTVRTVKTDVPSPFAASLQFGFVVDWLYGDDTPRAEQRAALLSLDRVMLDELLGNQGTDEGTLEQLAILLGRRRGTVAGYRARTSAELIALLDRAGDLTIEELRARVASAEEDVRGDPLAELLESGRAVGVRLGQSDSADRVILTENFPRYLAGYGRSALAKVRAGAEWREGNAADVVPDHLRVPALKRGAAMREILWRFVALAGPFSVEDVVARYGFPRAWVQSRLEEWQRSGRIVRGVFGGKRDEEQWCQRRLLEVARRRELAAATRAVEAVPFPAFAAFLGRWQHVEPAERVEGRDAVREVLTQLQGFGRPADGWERDYLPARVSRYDRSQLTSLFTSGEMVWIGAGHKKSPGVLTAIRFVERGSAAAWIDTSSQAELSEAAEKVLSSLARSGAAFVNELESSSGLGPNATRSALKELAAAGLVTSDTAEAMREVMRWRGVMPAQEEGDPTRWLPADFKPGPNRYVVQRRPNLRKLPKWRRPDRQAADSGWVGRWSLVRTDGIMGPELRDDERAAIVADRWLMRYGIVARDMWRRERPPVSWRSIYRELKRLEFRGDVRRGYFVRGLSGMQFALPAAVELLRDSANSSGGQVIVIAASDPANAYALPIAPEHRDPLARSRGRGGLLVVRGGSVMLSAESRGRRIRVSSGVNASDVTEAATALAEYLRKTPGRRGTRDVVVESVDGEKAATSAHAQSFAAAGFRRSGRALRFYSPPA
jgi:ATP-dependent helicase Lhr and Lhr-like helicase